VLISPGSLGDGQIGGYAARATTLGFSVGSPDCCSGSCQNVIGGPSLGAPVAKELRLWGYRVLFLPLVEKLSLRRGCSNKKNVLPPAAGPTGPSGEEHLHCVQLRPRPARPPSRGAPGAPFGGPRGPPGRGEKGGGAGGGIIQLKPCLHLRQIL
jgi:hypothetical protein